MNVSNQREQDSLLLPIEKMKRWRWQLGEAVFDFEVLPKSETSHAAYPPCTSLGRIRSFWLFSLLIESASYVESVGV